MCAARRRARLPAALAAAPAALPRAPHASRASHAVSSTATMFATLAPHVSWTVRPSARVSNKARRHRVRHVFQVREAISDCSVFSFLDAFPSCSFGLTLHVSRSTQSLTFFSFCGFSFLSFHFNSFLIFFSLSRSLLSRFSSLHRLHTHVQVEHGRLRMSGLTASHRAVYLNLVQWRRLHGDPHQPHLFCVPTVLSKHRCLFAVAVWGGSLPNLHHRSISKCVPQCVFG
jgi:hypothetical protein